jgi:Fic family protein
LVEAEALLAEGGEAADRVAVEVLGNIATMESAVELADEPRAITLADLLGIHQILMERSPAPEVGGAIRAEQNWIGGSSYNLCGATFVPPPAEHVPELFEDLTAYINGDEHPALVQAAIAHAQFETIHPFADGNGRAGRALIHVILRRRGLAPGFVPPVSLVLATWSDDYITGLTAFRHLHAPDSPDRSTAAHVCLPLDCLVWPTTLSKDSLECNRPRSSGSCSEPPSQSLARSLLERQARLEITQYIE